MILRKLKLFLEDGGGATAIEYGLVASLVVSSIVGGVALFGGNTGNSYNHIAESVK